MASESKVDTISEKTSANGVAIDSVTLKDGGATFTGAVTVGVDDTGKDVKLFGASAGAYALWDESANLLDLRGATAAGPGHLKLTTGELTVVDADVLGKIEFQAPLESDGTDAILVGAAIWAEADDTFAAGVNNTYLVFALGKSEAAAEKFRFTADNEIGIAGANYGTDGQVLTSGGAGAACAWEDASGAVTALNNATVNELLTVGATTTELEAEAKLLFDPPKLTIGNATAEDTSIVFDGNAQDFYIGLDDSADDLVIGLGATVGTTPAISITEDQDVLFAKTFTTTDDEGWIIGSGSDFWFGAAAGEDNIAAYKGGTQGQDATEGYIWLNPNGNIQIVGQENSDASLAMYGDQADDAGEQWTFKAHKNTAAMFLNVDTNVATQNFAFTEAGSGDADATWDDNVWDYAELFPWKTPLLNDGDINALWGMTVVLDGDFVRLAEAGEEDLVMGVVRPKGSTGTHGDGLGWHGRRKKDTPWNVDEYEDYTQVNWQEFLPNGNASYRHAYNKDEIPAYRLKDEACRDKNWHTKEENFYKDKDGNKIPVVVPSTAEEKVAANYIERTTHKQTGKILKRRIYADDYDETQPYTRRKDRPREWVLIGLLGQVPIRDTAVIPTTWTKMKNLASGIDKYFIK